jgi:hypothetical protein
VFVVLDKMEEMRSGGENGGGQKMEFLRFKYKPRSPGNFQGASSVEKVGAEKNNWHLIPNLAILWFLTTWGERSGAELPGPDWDTLRHD